MKREESILASIGLAIGAIFGIAGSVIGEPSLQTIFYEISSVGLIAATTFLAVNYIRLNDDYLATGFLVLAIGEAIMTVGTTLGQIGGQASFGAGMALYVPALLFISIPRSLPTFVRITGILASIPFAIAASIIFMGEQVLSTDTLPGAAYGLLSITIIGWIWTLLKNKKE